MKKARIAMVLLTVGMLLFGCGGKSSTSTFSPEESSIFVTREGTISSALVEIDENGYYDQERLQAFIQEYVTDYNTEHGGDKVILTSCTLGTGKGIAVFEYASGADLYGFTSQMEDTQNQAVNLTVSTVSEGLIAGRVSDGTWVRAKDGTGVPMDTVTKQGNLMLVSLEGSVTIQTEGKIQFYSGNVTLKDEFTAVTDGGKAYLAFK